LSSNKLLSLKYKDQNNNLNQEEHDCYIIDGISISVTFSDSVVIDLFILVL